MVFGIIVVLIGAFLVIGGSLTSRLDAAVGQFTLTEHDDTKPQLYTILAGTILVFIGILSVGRFATKK